MLGRRGKGMVVGRRLREVESAEDQTFVGTSSRWVGYVFFWVGGCWGGETPIRSTFGEGENNPCRFDA